MQRSMSLNFETLSISLFFLSLFLPHILVLHRTLSGQQEWAHGRRDHGSKGFPCDLVFSDQDKLLGDALHAFFHHLLGLQIKLKLRNIYLTHEICLFCEY